MTFFCNTGCFYLFICLPLKLTDHGWTWWTADMKHTICASQIQHNKTLLERFCCPPFAQLCSTECAYPVGQSTDEPRSQVKKLSAPHTIHAVVAWKATQLYAKKVLTGSGVICTCLFPFICSGDISFPCVKFYFSERFSD